MQTSASVNPQRIGALTHLPRSILVVDDEPEIRTTLNTYLTGEGFLVETVADGQEMRIALASGSFDLVLLDLSLRNESGLDLLKNIIADTGIAVVILTGKSDPIERVVGLELGADDYVVKPFLTRELLARINAVLRRTAPKSPPVVQQAQVETNGHNPLRVNDWLMDLQTRQVHTAKGARVELTGAEFNVLATLVKHVGEAVSRDELSKSALNREWSPSDRSVDIHIHNIRRKLSESHCKDDTIVTVRNFGYALAADIGG